MSLLQQDEEAFLTQCSFVAHYNKYGNIDGHWQFYKAYYLAHAKRIYTDRRQISGMRGIISPPDEIRFSKDLAEVLQNLTPFVNIVMTKFPYNFHADDWCKICAELFAKYIIDNDWAFIIR